MNSLITFPATLALMIGLTGCGQKISTPPGPADMLITSTEGARFVGDQLQAFQVDGEGVISTTQDAWINLYLTENKPFRLTGEVSLGGPSATLRFPADLPDGIAFYIREWDSLQRYGLTTRSIEVKRRRHSGRQEFNIARVAFFPPSPLDEWIPFLVEATAREIVFQVGEESRLLEGPLDMNGANKIALAPGTKVRNVRIEILDSVEAAPARHP